MSTPQPPVPSFAGGPRYPAPDVARGVMLLLIALANVAFWTRLSHTTAEMSAVDSLWVFVRAMFVDARSYPLFAMLFGFGLMTMVDRRCAAHIRARSAELDGKAPGIPATLRQQWLSTFKEESWVSARRLVRSRGWWMLLFGAVHALLFLGDIMGAYGVVAVLFAGLFAGRRWVALGVWGIIFAVLCVLMSLSQGWAISSGHGDSTFAGMSLTYLLAWWYPLAGLGSWLFSTVMSLPGSMIVVAVFIGAWLARTDFITRPDLHRRGLVGVTVGGMVVGVLSCVPFGLYSAEYVETPPAFSYALFTVGGLGGAMGWLALLALLAGPARDQLTGWRWAMSAVGRRSMTAYVSQSVLFAAVFGGLGLLKVWPVPPAMAAVIAVAVWGITVGLCVALEKRGAARGPLEVLLRRAVGRSEAKHTVQEIPVMSLGPAAT